MAKKFIFELEITGTSNIAKAILDTDKAIKELTKQIKEAKKAGDVNLFDNLNKQLAVLKKGMLESTAELKRQNKQFIETRYPVDSLKSLQVEYGRLTNKIRELSAAERKSDFGKGLISRAAALKNEINKVSMSMGDYSKNIGNYSNSIKDAFLGGFQFLSLAGLSAAAGVAIASLGKDAITSTIAIEKLYFQIDNLTDATTEDIDLFKAKIPELSNELGIMQDELVKGLYLINSSGVNGAKALEILETSGKAAAIGLGSVTDVARSITGIINAYGKENLSASRAAEILFQTVKKGSGNVDELASQFSSITPQAAKLGIPLEQLGTSIAVITNLGTKTSEAMTQLESVMSSFIKPTSEANEELAKVNLTMEEVRELAAIDFIGTLKLLNDAFDGNVESMGKIYGRKEAVTAALSLIGSGADEARQKLKEMQGQTDDLVKSFDKVQETSSQKWARLWTGIKNVALEGAGFIVDLWDGLSDGLDNLLEVFGKKSAKTIKNDLILLNRDIQNNKVANTDNPIFNKAAEVSGDFSFKGKEDFTQEEQFRLKAEESLKSKAEAKDKERKEKAKKAAEDKRKTDQHNAEFAIDQLLKVIEQEEKTDDIRFRNQRETNDKLLQEAEKAAIEAEKFRNEQWLKEKKQIEDLAEARIKAVNDAGKLAEDLSQGSDKPTDDSEYDKMIKKRRSEIEWAENAPERMKDAIKESIDQLKFASIDLIGNLALIDVDNEIKALEKLTEKRLESIDEEFEKKKSFAQGNAELLKKLDAEQQQQIDKVQQEQAKKQQNLAIKKVKIEGAIAIAKTFAQYGFPLGIPFAALQLALILKQIAEIKAQAFWQGGEVKPFKGHGIVRGAGTSTSDSIPARLSAGEYVLNKKMVDIIGLEPLERLRARTLGGGAKGRSERGYAEGGLVNSQTFVPNVNLFPVQNQNISSSISNESMLMFTDHFVSVASYEIKKAVALGLQDGNRRIEREEYTLKKSKQ